MTKFKIGDFVQVVSHDKYVANEGMVPNSAPKIGELFRISDITENYKICNVYWKSDTELGVYEDDLDFPTKLAKVLR